MSRLIHATHYEYIGQSSLRIQRAHTGTIRTTGTFPWQRVESRSSFFTFVVGEDQSTRIRLAKFEKLPSSTTETECRGAETY